MSNGGEVATPTGAALAAAKTPQEFLEAVDEIQKEHQAQRPKITEESIGLFPGKATPAEALEQETVTKTAIRQVGKTAQLEEERITRNAVEILKSGNPLEHLLTAYNHNHEGDHEILRAITYAACLQSSHTTHGLQLFISGAKGKGKTNAVKAALALLPPKNVINSSFSDKSFFVRLQSVVKPILYLDDTGLTDYQVQTIKRAMTNFQTVTEYTSLKKDFTLLTFAIPPRTLWLGTAVTQDGDDQLKDRFLTLTILPDPKDDESYVAWEITRRKEGRPEIDISEDIRISQSIFDHIRSREFVVKGFDHINFKYTNDRRLINIFLDLVEASAILNYKRRQPEEKDGVIYIHPTQDDISAALNFSMFTITDEKAEGRLTRMERVLDEIIQKEIGAYPQIELTERQIVDLYGKTVNACRVLLYGRNGSQQKITGGLLEKAPWYRIDREDVVVKPTQYYHGDISSDEVRRRAGQPVIVVSKHEYSIEKQSVFAWLGNLGCST